MTLPYPFPQIVAVSRVEYVLPFNLTVAAAPAQNTAVAGMIPFKYRVIECKTYFPDDAVNAVNVYWLMSRNNQGSTTGLPDGENLFANFVPTAFITGHAGVIIITCDVNIEEDRSYIKMHVDNNNAYAATITGLVKIRKVA